MGVEHLLRVVHAQPGQFADALQAVDERRAVDVQRPGGDHLVVLAVKERLQRGEVLGAVLRVVRGEMRDGGVKEPARASLRAAQAKQLAKADLPEHDDLFFAQGERLRGLRDVQRRLQQIGIGVADAAAQLMRGAVATEQRALLGAPRLVRAGEQEKQLPLAQDAAPDGQRQQVIERTAQLRLRHEGVFGLKAHDARERRGLPVRGGQARLQRALVPDAPVEQIDDQLVIDQPAVFPPRRVLLQLEGEQEAQRLQQVDFARRDRMVALHQVHHAHALAVEQDVAVVERVGQVPSDVLEGLWGVVQLVDIEQEFARLLRRHAVHAAALHGVAPHAVGGAVVAGVGEHLEAAVVDQDGVFERRVGVVDDGIEPGVRGDEVEHAVSPSGIEAEGLLRGAQQPLAGNGRGEDGEVARSAAAGRAQGKELRGAFGGVGRRVGDVQHVVAEGLSALERRDGAHRRIERAPGEKRLRAKLRGNPFKQHGEGRPHVPSPPLPVYYKL